jgi:hypothetical protein
MHGFLYLVDDLQATLHLSVSFCIPSKTEVFYSSSCKMPVRLSNICLYWQPSALRERVLAVVESGDISEKSFTVDAIQTTAWSHFHSPFAVLHLGTFRRVSGQTWRQFCDNPDMACNHAVVRHEVHQLAF